MPKQSGTISLNFVHIWSGLETLKNILINCPKPTETCQAGFSGLSHSISYHKNLKENNESRQTLNNSPQDMHNYRGSFVSVVTEMSYDLYQVWNFSCYIYFM